MVFIEKRRSDLDLYNLVQTPEFVVRSTFDALPLTAFHKNHQSATLLKNTLFRRLNSVIVNVDDDPERLTSITTLWDEETITLCIGRDLYQKMQTFIDPDTSDYSSFEPENDGAVLAKSLMKQY